MPQQTAPQSPAGLARKPVEVTDEVMFGDVWQRPRRSPRGRGLITVAAPAALCRAEQLGHHLRRRNPAHRPALE